MHELLAGKAYLSNEAVNANYDYTALEIDIMVKLIFLVTKERNPVKRQTVRMTYAQLMPEGANGSDYGELRKAFTGLLKKPIEIFYPETKQYFISNFLSAVTIQKHSGVILVELHPKMIALICDIRREFTGLEIESILKLKSKYAKRVYILLCQFKATGVRYLNLDELRKLLKLGDKYEKIADLKKRVLDVALYEINRYTEIVAEYEGNKQSRRITDIVFLMKLKPASSETAGNENQRRYMEQCGVAAWMINNAVHTLQPDELHRILYHVNINQDKIKNKGAYIAKMLNEAGVNTRQKLHFQTALL